MSMQLYMNENLHVCIVSTQRIINLAPVVFQYLLLQYSVTIMFYHCTSINSRNHRSMLHRDLQNENWRILVTVLFHK